MASRRSVNASWFCSICCFWTAVSAVNQILIRSAFVLQETSAVATAISCASGAGWLTEDARLEASKGLVTAYVGVHLNVPSHVRMNAARF
jgi:hypothetical protein